jgi:hypothetical protein
MPLKADVDIVHAAVAQNGHALDFAAEDLCDDFEVSTDESQPHHNPPFVQVVEAAVSNAGFALKYASPRLQANKDLVLKARTSLPFCLAVSLTCLRTPEYQARPGRQAIRCSDATAGLP